MPTPRPLLLALALAACVPGALIAADASADPPPSAVPPDVVIPSVLSLDEALRILNTRGLDLLIADAAVASAQADTQTAAAIANPELSIMGGSAFNFDPNAPGCTGCSRGVLNVTVSDNAAIFDAILGKRGLRVDVARAALAAAKLTRNDAKRNLELQVKQAYVQVVLAAETLDLDREIQKSLEGTLAVGRAQYPRALDEGGLARIEVQKLEGDQAVASDLQSLRQAKVALAFLLGARRIAPDFEVERSAIKFRVPDALATATPNALIRRAVDARPDVAALGYQRLRADASVTLARRSQVPDITLGASFASWAPPTLFGQVGANIPIFYQQQGEIRRARADLTTQSLQYAKSLALVAADVERAHAAFKANKELIERMEGGLLDRAKVARDIVEKQYRGGNLPLSDFLDAQRTYIATRQEYLTDLTAYWTAVFQLEQAVNGDLRR
jgi:cobalt-zinc-cadmium efflux system outer membrane protein